MEYGYAKVRASDTKGGGRPPYLPVGGYTGALVCGCDASYCGDLEVVWGMWSEGCCLLFVSPHIPSRVKPSLGFWLLASLSGLSPFSFLVRFLDVPLDRRPDWVVGFPSRSG